MARLVVSIATGYERTARGRVWDVCGACDRAVRRAEKVKKRRRGDTVKKTHDPTLIDNVREFCRKARR